MGRFTIIDSSIWTDREFEQLDFDGKLLYFYVLSSPIGNMAGYYRLPIKQIVCDLEIPKERIEPNLLSQKKLWKYDEKTSQILLPNYLKYNRIGGANQLKAINSSIRTLSFCELHIDFMKALLTYSRLDSWKGIDKNIVAETLTLAEQTDSEAATFLIDTFNNFIPLNE